MPSLATLRIVEPNLTGHAGHYGEFVRALASRVAPDEGRIEVDAGVGAESLTDPRLPHLILRESAPRGEWSVVRECVRDPNAPFLILTAQAKHAVMLQLARARGGTLEHVRLYFHWRESSLLKRMAALASPAVRRECLAVCPTPVTAAFLRRTGWSRVAEVPYPAIAPAHSFPATGPRHLLMAGAARMNKGLRELAGACETWSRQSGAPLPVLVQATGKRSGRQGRLEAELLGRLAQRQFPWLTLDASAPDRAGYAQRFSGAIVLAPYDPMVFADNVSGVALDALLHGAPVVATAGTWAARVVERFGAGVVMEEWTAAALAEAVSQAVARWETIAAAARVAAGTLAREHDPANLWAVLTSGRQASDR